MLIAALAMAAEPVAPVPADEEIVVVRRLRDWRGTLKKRDGALTCATKRSTGDKAIDAIGCDAMVACIAPLAPQMDALHAAKLPRREVEARTAALLSEAKVTECLESHHAAGVAALAEARRSKRS